MSGIRYRRPAFCGDHGLIKAVNTFDTDKGSRLATYAARCVENEILMLLRAGKKRAREVSLFEPIGTDKDGEAVNLVDVIEMENPRTIDQLILDQDIRELYEAFDTCLTESEKQVITMRYGLFREKEHIPAGSCRSFRHFTFLCKQDREKGYWENAGCI